MENPSSLRSFSAPPEGPMGFRDFMDWALYDPQHGYYSRGGAPGRGGDFFTSATVGSCFGTILALHVAEFWRSLGEPGEFQIIEQGANDGSLLRDLIEALRRSEPKLAEKLQVQIVEPLPTLQEKQRATLENLVEPRWATGLGELEPGAPGFFYANELLDALAVDVVRWEEGRWMERQVESTAEGGFEWTKSREPEADLAGEIEAVLSGSDWPEGYQTELHRGVRDWIGELSHSPFQGQALLFDYGFNAEDFRHPGRTEGTARRYQNHEASNDLLAEAGSSDLTAHVDWTRSAQLFAEHGWEVSGWADQERFLVRTAAPWLQSLEEEGGLSPELVRQFQTLVHPAFLGRSFQVMSVLSPGLSIPDPLRGFAEMSPALARLGLGGS